MDIKTIINKLKNVINVYDIWHTLHKECVTANDKIYSIYNLNDSDIYLSSMKIINMLDKFKHDKIKFINDAHDKFIKYINYALEECDTTIKLLLSIYASNIINSQILYMVNKLVCTDIQQYKYFISSQLVIPFIDISFNHITCDMLLNNIFEYVTMQMMLDNLRSQYALEIKYQHNEILLNTISILNNYMHRHGFYAKSVFLLRISNYEWQPHHYIIKIKIETI